MKRAATSLRILALIATVFGTRSFAQTWNSQLLPKVDGKFVPRSVDFAGRSWKLDDFSFVGYRLGTDALANVPRGNPATIAGTGDISAELQSDIDTIGAAGGGVVSIPAGTYTMSTAVSIPYDNVSIEGAGSGSTVIQVPAGYDSREATDLAESLFTFGRDLNTLNRGWVDRGKVVANVTVPIQRGATAVDTDGASGVAAGSWIVVQQYFWQGLVDANSHAPDAWLANSTKGHSIFSFSYLRRVVSTDGNRIVLDAPIPRKLDPADNLVRIRLTDGKMHQNCGIRGVTIQFENNVDARTGRPHGAAVYFEGVHDGWVYDVHVSNFPRYGLYTLFSARITFLDSQVVGAQDKGGQGYGYGFDVYGSQNILFRRCRGENNRHNFISERSLTSMIVYTRCVSANATQPDDTHYAFEQAILWDDHTQQNGASLEAFNRGDESTGAYETLASGVIWNFHGDGVRGSLPYGGGIYVKPSAFGEAIVVGVNGQHVVYDNSLGNTVSPFVRGDAMPASAGLQVGTGAGALGNVLYEGLYQAGLDPESLYEAQLDNRLGAPDWWPDPATHRGLSTWIAYSNEYDDWWSTRELADLAVDEIAQSGIEVVFLALSSSAGRPDLQRLSDRGEALTADVQYLLNSLAARDIRACATILSDLFTGSASQMQRFTLVDHLADFNASRGTGDAWFTCVSTDLEMAAGSRSTAVYDSWKKFHSDMRGRIAADGAGLKLLAWMQGPDALIDHMDDAGDRSELMAREGIQADAGGAGLYDGALRYFATANGQPIFDAVIPMWYFTNAASYQRTLDHNVGEWQSLHLAARYLIPGVMVRNSKGLCCPGCVNGRQDFDYRLGLNDAARQQFPNVAGTAAFLWPLPDDWNCQ